MEFRIELRNDYFSMQNEDREREYIRILEDISIDWNNIEIGYSIVGNDHSFFNLGELLLVDRIEDVLYFKETI